MRFELLDFFLLLIVDSLQGFVGHFKLRSSALQCLDSLLLTLDELVLCLQFDGFQLVFVH